MHLSDFDYELPQDRIAREPMEPRDLSRLLLLPLGDGTVSDHLFSDLPSLLREGDLLVLNDTKVIPARLFGTFGDGTAFELLLVRELGGDRWEALFKPSRKGRPGQRLVFAPGFEAVVEDRLPTGRVLLRFFYSGAFRTFLDRFGAFPLPPYLKRRGDRREDRERYQTVYAKKEGAIAAPTAGLHFTEPLLEVLRRRGVNVAFLTLHIGVGTFQPVRVEEVERYRMEPEWYTIPEETALAVKAARREGRRVIAVGTTTVRALESAGRDGEVKAGEGWADLFIYPGYRFQMIDGLITNFHLPRSTPLMLVSALVGKERILEAYRHAIEKRYRFLSYGDAMLIL